MSQDFCRPAFRPAVVALAVLLLLSPAVGASPNLILITADNLGFGDVGCYGNAEIRTPHLDALAREGVRCTAFYTASPTCTVSRATVLTGRLPQRIQLNHQLPGIAGNYGVGLRHYEKLIPAYLKEAGYATGGFGKWNIGFAPGSRPTERGFDEFIGNPSGNIDYYTYRYQGKHDLYRGTEEFNNDQYSTHLYRDAAIDFIRRQRDRPFFLYLPFNAPHFPSANNLSPGAKPEWQVPPEYLRLYGYPADEPDARKRYRAVVTALDAAIGAVLRTLDELGLRDSTAVMFYSDNGAFMLPGRGLEVASNAPFRDGGVTLWEGGIRVPALVRWPGRLPGGTTCAEPIMSTDLLPMMLRAAGLQPPADRSLDGLDPTATLAGQAPSPHDFLAWEYAQQRNRMRAIRDRQYKLIQPAGDGPFELYDLINDPGETRNLAPRKPAVVAALKTQLEVWRDRVTE